MASKKSPYQHKVLLISARRFKLSTITTATRLIQMEDQIRRALEDRDFAVAQTLADEWLTRARDVAVAHYFAAWCRDTQGSGQTLQFILKRHWHWD